MPPGSLEQVVFRMDVLHRLRPGWPCSTRPRRGDLRGQVPAPAPAWKPPVCRAAHVVCQHADDALEAFAALGGDVIVKPLFGSEGRGMVRVSDPDLAWRTFRTLERLQSVLYLQRYIAHPGWDLRLFVLGGRCIAAMRRRSNGGWRTNVAQGGTGGKRPAHGRGGTAWPCAPPRPWAPGWRRGPAAGPDGELYVLEVNAVPGWRALRSA